METAAEREGRLGKGKNSIFCKIFYHMRPQAVYICDRDLPSPKPKGMQNQLRCSDDTKEYVGVMLLPPVCAFVKNLTESLLFLICERH